MFKELDITSPKREKQDREGWRGFFPYYAGYSQGFAEKLIRSACLNGSSLVADPWNGSGTTTYSAAKLGVHSVGLDINPAMVVVAKARVISPSEADALSPLASRIAASATLVETDPDDPLRSWFDERTTRALRGLEQSIRRHLVGTLTLSESGADLGNLSSLAASFYCAMFAVCRQFASDFKSSNPTWLKQPAGFDGKVSIDPEAIRDSFINQLSAMTLALRECNSELLELPSVACSLALGDATMQNIEEGTVDLVLSSPPYCTRIDYAAATRVELAVLHDLAAGTTETLRRRMMGSTLSPSVPPQPDQEWGEACLTFLDSVRRHPSRASKGYYYNTHLDYFSKLRRSVHHVCEMVRPGGCAVLIVQDSYYKEVPNDLPLITTEMMASAGMRLVRRENFAVSRTFARFNPGARAYEQRSHANEAVLVFEK